MYHMLEVCLHQFEDKVKILIVGGFVWLNNVKQRNDILMFKKFLKKIIFFE